MSDGPLRPDPPGDGDDDGAGRARPPEDPGRPRPEEAMPASGRGLPDWLLRPDDPPPRGDDGPAGAGVLDPEPPHPAEPAEASPPLTEPRDGDGRSLELPFGGPDRADPEPSGGDPRAPGWGEPDEADPPGEASRPAPPEAAPGSRGGRPGPEPLHGGAREEEEPGARELPEPPVLAEAIAPPAAGAGTASAVGAPGPDAAPGGRPAAGADTSLTRLNEAIEALDVLLSRHEAMDREQEADGTQAERQYDIPLLSEVVLPPGLEEAHDLPGESREPPPERFRPLFERLASEIEVIVQTEVDEALRLASRQIVEKVNQHVEIILPEILDEIAELLRERK